MLITISIINYNYGRFVNTAIESALKQNANEIDVQVLVVDDGSTDSSTDVYDQYRLHPRIRISRSDNMGFGSSLDRAIREASGEWVMLLDADDWFSDTKLKTVSEHFIPSTHYIANSNRFVNDLGIESGATGSPGNTSTITVRRTSALDVLPVDDESGFHLLRFAGKGVELNDALTFHRIHNSSMSSNPQREFTRRSESYRKLVAKLNGWVDQRPDWVSEQSRRIAIKELKSMSTFAAIEAGIHGRRRWQAIRLAFLNFAISGIDISTIRTLIRTMLLRPIPSREQIFLSSKT